MIVGRVGGRSGHIYLRAAFCDSRQQCPVCSMMGRDGVADRPPFFLGLGCRWRPVSRPYVQSSVAVGHPLPQDHGSVTCCGDKGGMLGLHSPQC